MAEQPYSLKMDMKKKLTDNSLEREATIFDQLLNSTEDLKHITEDDPVEKQIKIKRPYIKKSKEEKICLPKVKMGTKLDYNPDKDGGGRSNLYQYMQTRQMESEDEPMSSDNEYVSEPDQIEKFRPQFDKSGRPGMLKKQSKK